MTIDYVKAKIGLYIALMFIVMNIIGLDKSPIVWMDEVTLNDPAKELAMNGRLISSVFSYKNGFDDAYYWQPPGQIIIMSMVYKIFGFGIWQTRIPGVLFASGVLVIVYLLSMNLFDNTISAILAAGILSFDSKFIESARSARMDTQALFFALLGIYVVLHVLMNNVKHRRLMYLSMGSLALGIAGVTHPISIVWVCALAIVIFLYRKRVIVYEVFWMMFMLILPFGSWLLYIYVNDDIDLFILQFFFHGESRLAVGSLVNRLVSEVFRYVDAYRVTPILLVIYLGSIVWFCSNSRRYKRKAQALLILCIVPIMFIAVFMSKTVGYYYLHPISLIVVVTGVMLYEFYSKWVENFNATVLNQFFRVVLVVVFIGYTISGILGRYIIMFYQWNERDYTVVFESVKKYISPGSIVLGPPDIWYAVEATGSSLRIREEPNKDKHDYVVTKIASSSQIPSDMQPVYEFGESLPLVLDRFASESADYRMKIWKW
ncbi:MAG TPA: hypothetical protein DGM69_06235 [Chloroflexi bacterium]|nr:hypothetical protein [Chloroflexota bacterium]|tara:strand:+ start:515 stop:1978 length:1464 start_codon:yes stop_codon:yes gene_type:complete